MTTGDEGLAQSHEIRDKVRIWLLSDGFAIEERAEEGLVWFLVAKNQSTGFGISQSVGRHDEIYIRITLDFDRPVQDALAQMSAGNRATFYSEVRFFLLSLAVEFQPEGEMIWNRLTISDRIFEDALTKDEFIRRIFNLHRAATGVLWLANESIPHVLETPTNLTVH